MMNEKPCFDDFIEIVKSDDFQAYVENFRNKHHPANLWNYKNPEKLKKSIQDYEKSVKGKLARKRVYKNRKVRMAEAQAELNFEEKIRIREFYLSCPPGCEVDHIVPISKGGKHCLSNLQYLTKEENRKKASRSYYKKKYFDN